MKMGRSSTILRCLILQTAAISMSGAVVCQHCGVDFKVLRAHAYRCKFKSTNSQPIRDEDTPGRPITSQEINPAVMTKAASCVEPLADEVQQPTTDSQAEDRSAYTEQCLCGRPCKGKRGLEIHRRSCAIYKTTLAAEPQDTPGSQAYANQASPLRTGPSLRPRQPANHDTGGLPAELVTCTCGRLCNGRRGLAAHQRGCQVYNAFAGGYGRGQMSTSTKLSADRSSAVHDDNTSITSTMNRPDSLRNSESESLGSTKGSSTDNRLPLLDGVKLPTTTSAWAESNAFFHYASFFKYSTGLISDLDASGIGLQ